MRLLSFKNSLLIISILIMSMMYIPASNAETLLPKIEDGQATPVADGNITAIEWKDSMQFNTSIGGRDAQVRVTTNSTYLFIGFNFTSSNFITVNGTLLNSTTMINNGTHDWIALQFDNNLDEQPIATETSADDVIVVDQFNQSSYDGFIDGNSTNPFVIDTENNGTSDGLGIRANYTIDEGENVVYEFVKTKSSLDSLGNDLDLDQVRILQFKLVTWFNQTSNSTTADSTSTEWFTLRVNLNGTGVALKEIGDTDIFLSLNNVPDNDFQAVTTVLSSFGFNVEEERTGGVFMSGDLLILVLGSSNSLSSNDTDTLFEHVRLGGKALIFLSNDDVATSNIIANRLGIPYLPNPVLLPGSSVNETENIINVDTFNSALPFIEEPTMASDESISNVNLSQGAFNISQINNKTALPFILSQDFKVYDMFESPNNLAYDEDNNELIDDGEDFSGLSLGLSIDLLKGGRISILPSSSLLSNELLTTGDNIDFLLKLLPWNARLTNTIEVKSVEADKFGVNPGDEVNIVANVTDGFGDFLDPNDAIEIVVEVKLTQNTQFSIVLTREGNLYVGTLTITRAGSLDIETTAFLDGYGFSEGQRIEIISEGIVRSFNDLSLVSTFLIVLFLISVLLAVVVWIKSKDMK